MTLLNRSLLAVALMSPLALPVVSMAEDSRIGGGPSGTGGSPAAGTPDTKGMGGEGGHSYGATVNVPTPRTPAEHPPEEKPVTDPRRPDDHLVR
ncbi:MAG TPA: hypothetical protein VGR62_20245 [Candidatus Binatia bacterium]|jgi:hypothetical protein|nr:hypothetical protein [Candidatus Binatia bacterium]